MELAIVIFSFIVSIATSLLIYHKNPRSGSNVYLSILILLIGIYPVFNYLAIHSPNDLQALFWAKAILLVSIPQGPLLFFFSGVFPGSRFIFRRRLQAVIIVWLIVTWVFAFAELIFESVSVDSGNVVINPGPFIPLFGFLHAGTIIAGIAMLYVKYRRAKDREKEQLTYVFFGILISFSLTFLITFILPLVLKNTFWLAISPIILALSVVAVAYAMVSRRLFDIRYVVLRSAAYTATRVLTTLLYTVPIMIIIGQFIDIHNDTSLLAYSIIVGIIFAMFYSTAHQLFDSVTNKLFFRRYYEPQEVLNRLSELLVVTSNLATLKTKSAILLKSAIKSSSFRYWIRDQAGSDDIDMLGKLFTGSTQGNVIFVDEYDESPSAIAKLRDFDIAVVVRLRTNKQTLGYATLGYKESGDIYRDRDKRLLGIAADEIAISLQNAMQFEEIKAFNITLQERVDEATLKLRASNNELRKLDETKDEFLSMASHQLRTPLTSIKGYISMVLDGDVGEVNDQQKKLLTEAFVSSERMVRLIGDFLNVSRLQTGKFVIERKDVDLANLVQDEIDSIVSLAKTRQITLSYTAPSNLPAMQVDEDKIRQVVMNFIDNAIYYSRSPSAIVIKLFIKDRHVVFEVHDHGIGVPKAALDQLFTKFFRAENARRQRPDGTGVGLYLAKRVIDEHGGELIVESTEGRGSVFGFRLPIK